MKSVRLIDILTETQIKQAVKLKDRILIRDELILPNMEAINKKLGQDNDPDYLSYAVVYALSLF